MRLARAFFALAFLLAACDLPVEPAGNLSQAGSDPIGHFCYISGEQSSCAAGLWCCSNHCSWMLWDNNNCGACGVVCTGGTTCQNGGCCASGLTYCNNNGTGCFNLENGDPNHCGGCNSLCVCGQHATAGCTNGLCTCTCNAGWGNCDNSWTNGCEVDLTSSTANCSACGNACTGGKLCCNSACLDVSADVNNCGACGWSCAASGAGPNMTGNNCCQGGKCGDLCHDGTTCDAGGGQCPTDSYCGMGCGGTADCCPYYPDNGIDQCVSNTFQTASYCGSCAGHCKTGHSCVLSNGVYVCN